MTNLHECPECHRMVKTLTRGVCHGRCYKKHIKNGTRDTLPRTVQDRVQRMDRIVEEYKQIMESHPELSQKEIASKLGIAASSLSDAAVKRGVRKPRPAHHQTRPGENYDYGWILDEYWRLIEMGEPEVSEENVTQIAARIGVSGRTLYRALGKRR